MLGLYAIFQAIVLIVWVIDILNIDFIINGVHVAYYLDVTVPINGWFWLLIWLLMLTVRTISKED